MGARSDGDCFLCCAVLCCAVLCPAAAGVGLMPHQTLTCLGCALVRLTGCFPLLCHTGCGPQPARFAVASAEQQMAGPQKVSVILQ
jgi:hypothetical protein